MDGVPCQRFSFHEMFFALTLHLSALGPMRGWCRCRTLAGILPWLFRPFHP
jgi:hypothetical protein